MAMTLSKSLGGFVAIIIIALVLILVIALGQIPTEILNILWYVLIAMIFIIAIGWLIYRKSSEGRKSGNNSDRGSWDPKRYRDEPRIGQTYIDEEE